MKHNARWHLRQAEKLLEQASQADEQAAPTSLRRWSYMERANSHIALARELRKAE